MKPGFSFTVLALAWSVCDAAEKVTLPLRSRVLGGGAGQAGKTYFRSKRAISSFSITDYRGSADLQVSNSPTRVLVLLVL